MMEHALRLTDVSITNCIDDRSVSLKEMHRRLNLVVIESAEHRRDVRRFLSSGLGPTGSTSFSGTTENDQGFLHFSKGHRNARLGIGPEKYWSVDGPSSQTSGGMDHDLPLWLNAGQRNCFANMLFVDCDSQQSSNSPEAVILALHSYVRRFAGESTGGWRSEFDYRSWLDESRQRKSRLDSINSEIHGLELQRQQLTARLVELRGNAALRLQAEQDVSATSHSVRHLSGELSRLEEMRDRLDREIAVLDAELQAELARPVAAPVADHSRLLRLVALFERIDEIDLQFESWQQVHTSIQEQRLGLRNESEKWTETKLPSDDHPFHKVWEIVEHIDSIVGQIENGANPKTDRKEDGKIVRELRFSDHPVAHQFARETSTNCERMDAGLRSLFGELESQYRQLRHKAAAAEMRQLRRSFDEVAAIMAKLTDRRIRLAEEAAHLDPQLDTVIQKREREFMQLLRTSGFQAARAHFLGEGLSYTSTVFTKSVRDTETASITALRNRLSELTQRRLVVDRELRQTRDQLQAARNRLHEQTGLLDRYRQNDTASIEAQEADLSRQIADRRAITAQMQRQIDDDSRRPAWVPSPALQMASQILERLSNGNLNRFDFFGSAENANRPSDSYLVSGAGVSDRSGRHLGMETLPAESRRDCRISLAFAAQRQMRILGEEMPLVAELSGPNLTEEWMIRFTRLLEQQGLADHQVVLLCDRRPVLSSDSAIERNDLFRIYDLNKIPVSESNARIVSWQRSALPAMHVEPPVVHVERVDQRIIQQPTHRFSSSLSELRAAPLPVSELPAVETAITEETLLRNLSLCPKSVCASLESARIFTVADLMELDPFEMPESIDERVVSQGDLDRIQAASWLMICVPGLSASDAQMLVNCGIVEPEQLDSTSADQLQSRIARYLATNSDSPAREAGQRYFPERLDRWFRSLRSTRDSWRRPSGYSRHERRRPDDSRRNPEGEDYQTGYFSREKSREYRPGDRYFDDQGRSRPSLWRSPDENDDSGRNRQPRETRETREPRERELRKREPREPREPRENSDRDRDRDRDERPRTERDNREPVRDRAEPPRTSTRSEPEGQLPNGMKFYLNLDDSVEAAPSIGPKTAERFEKIGVRSIREFLRTTSESMAEKLKYKRITADVIRQWQDQSRLVCRVPNLRGHDAQLLVACGVTEPEKLEGMSPNQLLSLVGPYSDTKEGLKIVRSGKKPDLAEVTDWINCARHTRSLTAA